jgi:MFS family permease
LSQWHVSIFKAILHGAREIGNGEIAVDDSCRPGRSCLTSVRSTLVLVSALVCFETMLFTVLAPLLPHYSQRFGLSVAEAGFLTAAYAAGALGAAVPSGLLATRIGVKATALSGLGLLAAASVAFGLAPDVASIFAARVAQGCGCALAWTGGLAWLVAKAPTERRGEVIGIALSAALAGALLGPAVGALAGVGGPGPVFVGLAVPACALVLWGATLPGGPPQLISLGTFRGALSQRSLVKPALLIALAGFLLGLVSVLAPLRLAGFGWSAPAIAVVFLLIAAAQAVLSPMFGRWSDRRGRVVPLRIGLVASSAGSLALASSVGGWGYPGIVLLAGVAFGLLWTPGMALLSDGAAELGLSLAAGFALMNLAWPPGQLVGSAGGGIIAQATSNAVPYLLACGLCLAGLAAFRLRRPRRLS